MVKFAVETVLACDARKYIADKDTAVYKKFHVRSWDAIRPIHTVYSSTTTPIWFDTGHLLFLEETKESQ
jgi:hypothetical protein|tara:strand:- start:3504 stop:3710 length:207 start_codon:yes stop_codon:yes gene_type:complete